MIWRQIYTLRPHKCMFKKINAIPFANFTEYLLDVNNVYMCLRVSTGWGSCTCASMDGCGYMLHLCFLHFNTLAPDSCEHCPPPVDRPFKLSTLQLRSTVPESL